MKEITTAKEYAEFDWETWTTLMWKNQAPSTNLSKILLDNAIEFRSMELPSDINMGEIKQCFMNATNLYFERKDLTYCEGYGYSGLITTHHAWCIDSSGMVYDNTWEDPVKCSYFGIPFKNEYLNEVLCESGHYALFYNDLSLWTRDPKDYKHPDFYD